MLVVLRWWFVFCAVTFGLAVAGWKGFFGYMLNADASYLSSVTLALFAMVSIWIGQLTWQSRFGSQEFKKHLPLCWFLAEGMMGLGMLGTLTGFMLLLGIALGQPINTADTAAMTALISKMGIGFSTAAVATAVGLACSMLIKLQLINLEYLVEGEDS